MGYIDAFGKYHKGPIDPHKLRDGQQSTYKQSEQNRQRKDYAREIIQPRNRDGSPNEHFVQAYPEESKEWGFVPKDEDLIKE